VSDGETTHLFTIDENGIKLVKENTPVGGNSVSKHTNLSEKAAFGGEVKFNQDGSVTINPYSGRFGVGNSKNDLETKTKLENTKKYFESLGYNVKTEFTPKSDVQIVKNDKIFTKDTIKAPSGKTYNFYGQKVDLDLVIKGTKNPKTQKPYTNREWMKKGNNPYIRDKNGNVVTTQQHHSQQNVNGPIFEIKTKTHQKSKNQQILHPYKKSGEGVNPNYPVTKEARKIWDNKDRPYINKERLKQLEKKEDK
ncbi:MAG: hypothetical protein GY932_00845, partial [Arcobacter sp.]|nr:hypothetical protein [Arcobacter sp.]